MTVADRISVMDHGKIVQIAPPAEIYEAPNSRYVADFIGSVNIFEGTVEERRAASGRGLPRADGLVIDAVSGGADEGPDGLVRGRPEKVRIAHDAPADEQASMPLPGEVLGHRLFRRHDALQRAARLRKRGARDADERAAQRRAADHLGRQGLALLGARRRRRADEMNEYRDLHRRALGDAARVISSSR